MILLDANLLVYAFDVDSPHHSITREWLDRHLAGPDSVGFPWESITAFLRLVTNPRIYQNPAAPTAAWRQVEVWLDGAPSWVPLPTKRHRELFREFAALPGMRANHVHDAHLATLALEHGLVLCSADRGFSRFPRLRWLNPLVR